MHPLKDLRWTTRTEVCERLLAFLGEATAVPSGTEEIDGLLEDRAAELFALLADESHVPVLRRLLMESGGTQWKYRDALVRLKASLPPDEVRMVLEEQIGAGGRCNFMLFPELFSTSEAQATALEIMEGWTPAQRAWALKGVGWHDSLRGLADWLYERWLKEDRWQLEGMEDYEGPLNRTAARYTAISGNLHRPESKEILLDLWRKAPGQPPEKLEDVWDVPAAWVQDRPEELRKLAESFALRHADLVSYFGTEHLLQMADVKLREISRRLRAEPGNDARIRITEFSRLVSMLVEWPEPGVRERIRSLIACPDIATDVRWEFCDRLWEERREEMTSLTLAAGQLANDRELVKRVLRWLTDDAQPTDRPLLWWAAFQESDWELPYWAMQGLEHLGEASEAWYERLHALSQSAHPFLRLQASGALARRGVPEAVEVIMHAAKKDKDPCVRGEAVRVLGQLGSVEHLGLIQRALCTERPVYNPDHSTFDPRVPAAEEAALALGRIGTTEAMTALIQAFLFLPEVPPLCWAQMAAEDALATLVARMDGESRSFETMSYAGWRWAFFKPWPWPSFKLAE